MSWLEDLRDGFGLPTLSYTCELSEENEFHKFTAWTTPKTQVTVEGDTHEEAIEKLDRELGPLRPAIEITGGQPVSDAHRERCFDRMQVPDRECCLTPDTPPSVVRKRPEFPAL